MGIRIKPWTKNGMRGFEVDIRGRLPDGTKYRERVKAPASTQPAALRWAQQREAEIIKRAVQPAVSSPTMAGASPTLSVFMPRYIQGHVVANALKPSYKATVERTYRNHLKAAFGSTALDAITDEDIGTFKGKLLADGLSKKTVNNIILNLSGVLRCAEEWRVISQVPRFKLLKTDPTEIRFFDFVDYARLVKAASQVGPASELVVLLGGDAGLRRGEVMGLEWKDVDFARGFVLVTRAVWEDHVSTPKGGRSRRVPMTAALSAALRAHRHLRSPRVLCGSDGSPADAQHLASWLNQAIRKAGIVGEYGLHSLRHTFCSHLAMRGAPAKAIQELAGHANLTTTLLYMHLSPAARESAIHLLNTRPTREDRGDTGETDRNPSPNAVER